MKYHINLTHELFTTSIVCAYLDKDGDYAYHIGNLDSELPGNRYILTLKEVRYHYKRLSRLINTYNSNYYKVWHKCKIKITKREN